MSALTDIFSALANKIRSKTGGSETYTPAEMVSDGIDDVYDAGVAAGTPTLDGDATTGNVLSGKTFYSNSTTKQTGSMTNHGNFQGDIDPSASTPYELPAGYYSDIELDVLPHTASSPSSSTYTSLAMGESKSIDLGQYHKNRYVRVQAAAPSGNKAITANGSNIDVSAYATVSVSVSGTAITPSNSSPASMSSGTLYTPSAAGYAISSYSSVTPSNSSPASLTSGSIYKMSGAGKAVASVTDVTPSNSSPATLSSGTVYKMGGNGKAVASVTSVAPSNSSPASLASGTVYKPSANGYAISSYSNVTPSSIGAYFASGMTKMSSSGYAYSAEQPKTAIGTFTASTTANTSVDIGFEPKYLAITFYDSTTKVSFIIYDSSVSASYQMIGAKHSKTNSAAIDSVPYTGTIAMRIRTIDTTGFTVSKINTDYSTNGYYFALG